MRNYLFLSILLFFIACKEEKETPKVRYEKNTESKAEPVKTSQIQVADLPIHFEGTSVLIHPIGDLRVYEQSSYSKRESQSYTISNYSDNQITGYLQNLKFQQIGSDSLRVLTDKHILIETATYLKPISDKTKKQFMVYTLADNDTNQDGSLDENDIKSLYMSDVLGSSFTKISPDLQEIIDWNTVENLNRLYFRTIEDINKNGAFDKSDKVHYYYIDLSKEWKAVEYMPV